MPAQINSLTTDSTQVALIIAAHNAAIEYAQAATNGEGASNYAANFDRIYSQLVLSTELGEDDEDDDDDDEDEDDDEDDDEL